MRRVWVLLATTCTLVVVGCGVPAYNERMKKHVEYLSYMQAIETYLMPETQGKFKEMNVHLRLPKPGVDVATTLAPPAGLFDHIGSYQAQQPAPATKEGSTPVVYPPLKIYVFLRQKPKKAAAKKGEAAPAVDPNVAARGNFIADVRATIASEFGPDAANDKTPVPEKIGDTSYKKLVFAAANSGDDVRAYFAGPTGDVEVALVFDIPKDLRNQPIVTKGVDYCLRSFSIGGSGGRANPAAAKSGGGPAF